MDRAAYLNRIGFSGEISPRLDALRDLHECHVRKVPFENLDVQNKVLIQLNENHLIEKVVTQKRGGFCYELNYLFGKLLTQLGFQVKMVSARVYDDEAPGPEFDHLALIVQTEDKRWLADVGFGDLFVTPIALDSEQVQFDGRNYFKLQKKDPETYLLSMSTDGKGFEKKYSFTLLGRVISDFQEQCDFKQFSPESYFVKNRVVTVPSSHGRKTIFNEKFISKDAAGRKDMTIEGTHHLHQILQNEFDIFLH